MADAGAVSRDETLRKGDADEQNKTMDYCASLCLFHRGARPFGCLYLRQLRNSKHRIVKRNNEQKKRYNSSPKHGKFKL